MYSHFFSSFPRSLITNMQATVAQERPNISRMNFINPFRIECMRAVRKPIKTKGIIEQPTVLTKERIDLYYFSLYPLHPRSLQLRLTRSDPIQNIRKTLMKSYQQRGSSLTTDIGIAKRRQMIMGPQRSHFLRQLTLCYRCLGSMRRIYLTLQTKASAYLS